MSGFPPMSNRSVLGQNEVEWKFLEGSWNPSFHQLLIEHHLV